MTNVIERAVQSEPAQVMQQRNKGMQ